MPTSINASLSAGNRGAVMTAYASCSITYRTDDMEVKAAASALDSSVYLFYDCCHTDPGGVMLLSIEPDSPVPIYQQIRDRIVEAIARGRQPAGSALPPIRQLA